MIGAISADELHDLVPLLDAVDALDDAFAGGMPASPLRSVHDTGGSQVVTMPSWDADGIGVKVLTLTPTNPGRGLPLVNGVYVLMDPRTGEPQCLVDAPALTALRTAATTAVATRHLASPDASSLVMFGAGRQASAHVEAMLAVRPIRRCVVVSPVGTDELVLRAQATGIAARAGTPEDVAEADIVCTCTTSATPVFDGRLLPENVHVNAIGAYRPGLAEVDDHTVRTSAVWVDERAAAREEAGDLIRAATGAEWGFEKIRGDLALLCSSAGTEQSRVDQRTLFKSVGIAGEDLVIAELAYRRLRS